MKKNYELYLFIALQIVLVLIYIYKESRAIEIFYQHQRLEKQYDDLVSQAKAAEHQLQAVKNRTAIQKYARDHGLEHLSLPSVRKLHAHEPT